MTPVRQDARSGERDKVFVRGLALHARHGVLPEERRLGQRFVLDIVCELGLDAAGASDDVRETVSYADLVEVASRVCAVRDYALIEALAEAVAAEILAQFPLVDTLSVRVEKPGAPIPAVFETVGVEIHRSR